MEASEQEHRDQITLIVVYGVNKPLPEVKKTESIERVKLAAMGLFHISASEGAQYVLKAKVDGKEEQLDEVKTVEFYRLHNDQKVTLSAGTPFGWI